MFPKTIIAESEPCPFPWRDNSPHNWVNCYNNAHANFPRGYRRMQYSSSSALQRYERETYRDLLTSLGCSTDGASARRLDQTQHEFFITIDEALAATNISPDAIAHLSGVREDLCSRTISRVAIHDEVMLESSAIDAYTNRLITPAIGYLLDMGYTKDDIMA